MKKSLALILVLAFAVAMLAGCGSNASSGASPSPAGSASPTGSGDKLTIVATIQSSQINFWSNVEHTLQRLAKENDFNLVIMDIKSDTTTFQNIIENIVAMKPDGVITCGLEASTLTTAVKTLQQAKIPVVTYNIQPDQDICPMVVSDQTQFGYVAGTAAAQKWKEAHPNDTPYLGAVDLYSAPVCALRVEGFVQGFQTVYPDAKLVAKVDGSGTRTASLSATEDMLQGNPQINVIFGINADSALGGLDALKELNRGTIDKSLVASVDGTEADCAELMNETSALKAVAGNSPRIMAETAYKILTKVLSGEIPADKPYTEKMSIVAVTTDTAQKWVTDNFE